MKIYRYLVVTDDEKIVAVRSKSSLDVENKSQMDWLKRLCDGKEPIIIVEIGK